jgi:hypothetical protein
VKRRSFILLAALTATLLLAWYTPQQKPEPATVELAAHGARPALTGPVAPAVAGPVRTKHETSVRFLADADLFPVQSWRPPPPPPPPLPPPPPPVPPPLPFSLVGQWQQDGVTTLFLTDSQNAYSVHKGDVVGQWRLDGVAAGQLTFTYLPMGKQQTMRFSQ